MIQKFKYIVLESKKKKLTMTLEDMTMLMLQPLIAIPLVAGFLNKELLSLSSLVAFLIVELVTIGLAFLSRGKSFALFFVPSIAFVFLLSFLMLSAL